MITSNLKSKLLISIKENINTFSYKVNDEIKEKKPTSIDVLTGKLKVILMLDNTDVGKIQDIKLLDHDKQELFKTEAIYYKTDDLGIYISFEISDIVEVE